MRHQFYCETLFIDEATETQRVKITFSRELSSCQNKDLNASSLNGETTLLTPMPAFLFLGAPGLTPEPHHCHCPGSCLQKRSASVSPEIKLLISWKGQGGNPLALRGPKDLETWPLHTQVNQSCFWLQASSLSSKLCHASILWGIWEISHLSLFYPVGWSHIMEPIVYIFFQFCIQWHHVDGSKSVIVGFFAPWR